jgi:squalene-associated FAD-dependent desaturase
MPGRVHVIGAGLAGLAAALRLGAADGRDAPRVVLHEAAAHAGGRCRSYLDPQLDATIDNGNHLVLSGNRDTLAYCRELDSLARLSGPGRAEFRFVDLANRARWTLNLSEGRVPWWIFSASQRVPGTRARDYFKLAGLLFAKRGKTMGEVLHCAPALYKQLIHPLFLAVLNTDPAEGDARLAGKVLRETLGVGGSACHPLIARQGLDAALIAPALERLRANGTEVKLQSRLRAIEFDHHLPLARSLDFGTYNVELNPADAVLLAVPPNVAQGLLPGLSAPDAYRSIVNAHFMIKPPPGSPAMLGVINGTVEWIFAYRDRLSITISAADRLLDTPRETLAELLWSEVAAAVGLEGEALPRWQIVREKRATFAATPAQEARRPAARTHWHNLALAGDWTATGLPATIEGAIRSGNTAADLLRTRGFVGSTTHST